MSILATLLCAFLLLSVFISLILTPYPKAYNYPYHHYIIQKITHKKQQHASTLLKPNITQCPPLSPRPTIPKSVHNLRPDDIKYVMALGDSITAAFAAKGKYHDHPLHIHNIFENRGVSFAAGGDEDAQSLANFIKFYREDLVGFSVGDHLIEICKFCPENQYRPKLDRLNAAQSGASVINLEHEMNYLLERIEELQVDMSSFKFLNLFIGSNDICNSCKTERVTPRVFEAFIRDTLDTIESKIPNTIVNLLGVFNVSQVYEFAHGRKYCRWFKYLPQIQYGCACAFLPGKEGDERRKKMDEITLEYNKAIKRIVADYASRPPNPSFGLSYHPFELNLTSFPIESVSNVDCFHPSVSMHQHIAKVLWNNLPINPSSRVPKIIWNPKIEIRCFMDEDRILTVQANI
ncbi:13608_t:CDS:2 [Ambispora leptoticha]|uniref:13608_t:CDS:1 n=1 Tax=Ambispora leptoticha TaxID=144679 RepID=A0A9N9ANY5_9GLOM|nr:13608_t:CDS:2 [Ambispora leptoticha]